MKPTTHNTTVCPNCDLEQPMAELCRECGVGLDTMPYRETDPDTPDREFIFKVRTGAAPTPIRRFTITYDSSVWTGGRK